jgi:amino acid transporter
LPSTGVHASLPWWSGGVTMQEDRLRAATDAVGAGALAPKPLPPAVELPEPLGYRLKNRLLGKPLHTEQLAHERLGKPTALAVFASDNLSSSAYATEEILRVLIPAIGVAAFSLVVPITAAMLAVLALLILSYRQTIKAYPSAGGAYIVTRDNFGLLPAQVAGVALLTDYILTVAVSVAAGTAALTSAASGLRSFAVPISVGFIVLIAFGNLRGVRESGKLFGVPTYFFIVNMVVLLGYGIGRILFGHLPVVTHYSEGVQNFGSAGDGLFLGASLYVILHAFASGGAAVTGVEAISNGVPAFRRPEWKNARQTLVIMGSLLGAMFLGLSVLAGHLHVAPYKDGTPTVISQVGEFVYGTSAFGHLMYYALQASTMMILVLAANTSFADFPRLASFHAGDNFMPRQLTKRGHRLVFSNGIIALAAAAIVLVVVTGAKVDRLIPLYAIGVFTSFTLSQAGMARHHLRLREPGWRRGLWINGAGAVMSFIVDIVIAVTKFAHGAWVIIIVVPLMVAGLVRLNRQYEAEQDELAEDAPRAAEAAILRRHVVLVFVDGLDVAAARAIQYARTLMPDELRAVHFNLDPIRTEDLVEAWRSLGFTRLALDVVECPDRRVDRAAAEVVAHELVEGQTEVTVLLPRREYERTWHRLLHDRTAGSIARALSTLPHCNVTIVPYHLGTDREEGARLVPHSAHLDGEGEPVAGRSAIGRVAHRERVRVEGKVHAIRVQPRAGVATLECTIVDDTGPLTVVFLGRRDYPGLHTGRNVIAEGVIGEHHGRLAMLNPRLELLADPHA